MAGTPSPLRLDAPGASGDPFGYLVLGLGFMGRGLHGLRALCLEHRAKGFGFSSAASMGGAWLFRRAVGE